MDCFVSGWIAGKEKRMSNWQFWTGFGRDPNQDFYSSEIQKHREEEAKLAERVRELEALGPELAAKHGLDAFIGVRRNYPFGTSIPSDPRARLFIPPPNVITLGFQVSPPESRRVFGRRGVDWDLEGCRFYFGVTRGCVLWIKEENLENLSRVFSKKPPPEERVTPKAEEPTVPVKETGFSLDDLATKWGARQK